MSLTVDKVRAAQIILEREITKLVREFEDLSTCSVESVDLMKNETINDHRRRTITVGVTVQLPRPS